MERQELIDLICRAFDGIKLGNGIGLYEADAIDDRLSIDEIKANRDKDQKDDWRLITAEDMGYCYSSTAFFDPDGMRFHLPALMICTINRENQFDIVFTLTYDNEHNRLKFTTLNALQREAIIAFLNWFLENDDSNFHRDVILDSLVNGEWKESL